MTTHTRHPIRWMARWTAVLLLTVIGTIGLAGTAAAHTDLTSSDPAAGSTLAAPPGSITLTFNEPVQNFEPVITLTGPEGQPYPTSAPIVDSTVVRSDVAELGPAGTYTIAYRVVSVDGHPVTGQVQFQFAPAAEPTPTAPPAAATPTAESTTATASPVPPTSASSPTHSSSTGLVVTTSAAQPGLAVTSTDGTSGPSGWVWAALAGVAVLIAAAAAVILRQRRQQRVGDE